LFALCFPYLVPITLFVGFGSIMVLLFPSIMDNGETGVSNSSSIGVYGLIMAPLAGILVQVVFGLPSNLLIYLLKSDAARIPIATLQSFPLMFIILIFGTEPESGFIGFVCNVIVCIALGAGSYFVYNHVKG